MLTINFKRFCFSLYLFYINSKKTEKSSLSASQSGAGNLPIAPLISKGNTPAFERTCHTLRIYTAEMADTLVIRA